MNITPDTNIRLLKCPLKIDNKNQLTFSNATAQYNYFNSLNSIDVEENTYQRKDSSIYFDDIMDNLIEYNYVMYQNNNYGDKWFYAFITNMEYVNSHCTRIEIATDVFQSWQFDIEYKNSFVVREHTNNDTIGNNLIEEDLNHGELIAGANIEGYAGYNIETAWIGVLCDYDPADDKQYAGVFPITGSTFGSKLYLFFYDVGGDNYNGMRDLNQFIIYVNKKKGADQIKNMFIIPNAAIDSNNLTQKQVKYEENPDKYFKYYEFTSGSLQSRLYGTQTVPKYGTYTDYTPKNNKCYTYPYCFLRVSNNVGNVVDYRWEDFSDTIPQFKSRLTISIGCSGILIPQNYKGIAENIDEGIPLAKYPVLSWSADAYTNWLTQNAVNRPLNLLNSLIGVSGSVSNTVASQPQAAQNTKLQAIQTMNNVAGTISQDIGNMHEAGRAPNISQNSNNGDVLFASGGNGFLYQYMRVKTEYLKMIDNYFTMFGYKTNELKVPNINGRSNWNYVETRNINLLGNIPQGDLDTIRQMFNTGITLWHTTEYFLDYSRTNSIVS